MDERLAVHIIRSLAGGNHPFTGAPLPDDGLYQHPHVIRALWVAHQALHARHDASARPPRKLPLNAGKPWDERETASLAAQFQSGKGIREIARALLRTPGAVEARLQKIGLIAPPPWDGTARPRENGNA